MHEDKKINEIIENNQGYIVMNIGRLTYQKGQDKLIRAFKKVVKEVKNAKLLIFGKGELKEELQELIKSLELENNVILAGFYDNPYKFLKKANIFAFSSMFEGLGNILLEAMACRVPIISTGCPYGPREIIAPNSDLESHAENIEEAEYGILVPVLHNDKNKDKLTKQEEIIANAIIKLLKDNKKRKEYAEKSAERIKFFTMEKNKKEWEDLIEN